MTVDERLKRLSKMGWALDFTHDWFGSWDFIGARAGDCSCPVAKEWDPSDGHGYSEIDEREIDISDMPDDPTLEWWLDRVEPLIFAIKPGASR